MILYVTLCNSLSTKEQLSLEVIPKLYLVTHIFLPGNPPSTFLLEKLSSINLTFKQFLMRDFQHLNLICRSKHLDNYPWLYIHHKGIR